MAQAAELNVIGDNFAIYNDLGQLVDIDLYGYLTRTPGFLFYPGAEPESRWVWEGNSDNDLYRVYANVRSVSFDGTAYSGILDGLSYYKIVDGAEVQIGSLSLLPISPIGFSSDVYYTQQAAELGALVANYVSANGMVVTGSGGVDNFSGNDFGLTATISWALGAGDDWLITQNYGVDTVDGGADDDHIETLGGDDTVRAGAGDDFIGSGVDNDQVYAGGGKDTGELGQGDDRFYGEGGDDSVSGGEGNDVLDGGAGADQLEGGTGDDIYFVDTVLDDVIEAAGNGAADRVAARVSYTLAADADIERLTTTSSAGTTAINLTGNTLSQEIVGNAGLNILKDGGGAGDLLRGLGGNDTYLVYSAATRIVESATEGTVDRVAAGVDYRLAAGAHVEQMTTSSAGGTAAIDLAGNEFVQMITGNAGANRLEGKGGADQLRGLGGADTFVFATRLGEGNIDTILDFSVPDDRLLLSNTIFTALTPGTLAAAAFRANATGSAAGASDRIIYETDTGKIFYDADGTGAAAGIHFATVTAGLALTNLDFSVA